MGFFLQNKFNASYYYHFLNQVVPDSYNQHPLNQHNYIGSSPVTGEAGREVVMIVEVKGEKVNVSTEVEVSLYFKGI